MRLSALVSGVLLMCTWVGCGEDGNQGDCDLTAPDCAAGLVCAAHADGQARCVAPVVIRGRLLDAVDATAIADGLIQAADINAAAVGHSDRTDSEGRFELTVPVARAADGLPTDESFTLRAQAAGYQPFPFGLRAALPLDAAAAQLVGERWVIENPITEIRLIPLPGGGQGLGSISGSVLADRSAGILMVAEGNGPGQIGFSDADGQYSIFNLPAGDYAVRGYAAGVQLTPAQASLAAGEHKTGVDLTASGDALASVSGRVQIVNAPGESRTSVVLAVESTFVENAARGEVPPGLRAPPPGEPPAISGEWRIEGVPAGRYVVLAAFENDGLVRDPDPTISGTQLLHLEVGGQDIAIPDGFKITEALAVIGPGAAGIETVVAPTPIFEWADDSGETRFEIRVFDAFGEEIWVDENVPKHTGSGNPAVQYAGPELEPGLFYQFRSTSHDADGPLSQTEDLKGVFRYQP